MVIFLLSIVTPTFGQSVTLPSTVYRPGRYMPLRLEANGPGTIVFSGTGAQAVQWDAPGRSSVVVPLLLFWDDRGNTTLSEIKPIALADTDADPPDLISFWKEIDPHTGSGPGTDVEAYAAAALWEPGRSSVTRRWTLFAVVMAVLVLGVARHVEPKRATRWLAVAAVGLLIGLVGVFPRDVTRRVLPADGRPGWEWVWYAGNGPQTVTEAWTPGLRYVPRDGVAAAINRPTLHCDAAGRPTGISVDLPRDARAVFIRPRLADSVTRPFSPPASEQ